MGGLGGDVCRQDTGSKIKWLAGTGLMPRIPTIHTPRSSAIEQCKVVFKHFPRKDEIFAVKMPCILIHYRNILYMDDIDQDILSELRKNAKVSLKALGKKLGTPLSTIYQRIKKLESDGYIRNYTVSIDWKKLGYGLKAYVMVYVDTTKLKELRKPQMEILDELRNLPFVDQADMVTGDADMVIVIRAKDTADLGRLITEKIQAIPGIVNTKTWVSIT